MPNLNSGEVGEGARLLIEDAHSRNGTWVNGAQLTPSLRPVPVDGTTRITLGGVNLVVSVGRSGRGA